MKEEYSEATLASEQEILISSKEAFTLGLSRCSKIIHTIFFLTTILFLIFFALSYFSILSMFTVKLLGFISIIVIFIYLYFYCRAREYFKTRIEYIERCLERPGLFLDDIIKSYNDWNF